MFLKENNLGTTRFLSACLQTALLLMSVFHTGISSVKADVRCYCNLPVCVTSGYMCKSSLGICVSDFFDYSGDLWRSRHACLELISKNSQEMAPLECPDSDPELEKRTYPTRLCCQEDMCNYFRNVVDSQDPIYRLNHSYMT
ncbi:BMP and activin membrane-bound inhibitor homolog, partial [Stegodyphus dumicola]|uniref:BMP and activin membrane-bound inhibitor homolog n=1 Tax=Stegodyphus dumicola TaxID=202533 RepID=UPI0015ADE78D